MKIIYSEFGIGMLCNDGKGNQWIELNKHLKEFPELHQRVLAHELRHYNNKKDGTRGFGLDMKIDSIPKNIRYYIPFMKKYPHHCLESLSPFMFSERDGWGLNLGLLLIYFLFLMIIILVRI